MRVARRIIIIAFSIPKVPIFLFSHISNVFPLLLVMWRKDSRCFMSFSCTYIHSFIHSFILSSSSSTHSLTPQFPSSTSRFRYFILTKETFSHETKYLLCVQFSSSFSFQLLFLFFCVFMYFLGNNILTFCNRKRERTSELE